MEKMPWQSVLGVFLALYALAASFGPGHRSKLRRKQAGLMEEMRPQFEAKYGRPLIDFLPVTFTPTKSAQLYEGDAAWDVGYLEVNEHLHYLGDQVELEIEPSQITKMRVQGYWRPELQITYAKPDSSELSYAAITLRNGSTPMDQFAELQALRRRLCRGADSLDESRDAASVQTGPPPLA